MTESRDEQLKRLDEEAAACRGRLAQLKVREIELQAEMEHKARQTTRQKRGGK